MINAAHEFGALIHKVFDVQLSGRFSAASGAAKTTRGSIIDPFIDPKFREEFMYL